MTTVTLSPGDILQVKFQTEVNTPVGKRTLDTPFELSYEDLISKLDTSSSKKGKNEILPWRRFSKSVATGARALTTGRWHQHDTPADKESVVKSLFENFKKLPKEQYGDITDNSKVALVVFYINTYVQQHSKSEVKKMLDALSIDPSELEADAKALAASYKDAAKKKAS